MVVPPAQRTSGAAASPKSSTPSVTPFASTVVITPALRDDAAGGVVRADRRIHRGLQGSVVGGAETTAKQRTPASFVAPNARDRRSFSVIDNRRGENSSPCRMGFR
jgi:hypothetical protein